MKRMIPILFCFFMVACSVLTGAQKRTLPPRKQSLLFNAIENKDIKTIASLMQRYDIESFVPKDLFEEQHAASVEQKKKPKKRPSKKRQKKVQRSDKKTNSKDHGLYDAVLNNSEKMVALILNRQGEKISKDLISKAFLKTVSGEEKNLKPEIAKIFLKHKIAKEKLSWDVLDRAFIKSIRLVWREHFFIILRDSTLRKNLYKCKKTKKAFNKVLKLAAEQRKWVWEEIIRHQGLYKRLKKLDFIPQEIRDKANRSKEGQELFQAIENNDKETIAALFDESERDETLNSREINNAFLRTVTGLEENLRLEIAALFLDYQFIRNVLEGYVLDNAFIRSIQYTYKPLFSNILRYKELRAKLYVNEETGQKNKQTSKRFEANLKRMAKWNRDYLDQFLLHDDLLEKVQHLPCITQDIIEHVLSLKDYGLYDAVYNWDLETVKKIFDKYAKKLRNDSINRAFVRTVKGENRERLRLSIAQAFLDNQYIKKKLYRTSLDKAVMRSMRLCRTFFSNLLRDKFVRCNIYKSKETQGAFTDVLRYASENSKILLTEFLSYSELRKRVKHLPFITSKMLNQARRYRPELLFDEDELSEKEKELLNVIGLRDIDNVRVMLDNDHEDLGDKTVNEVFYRVLKGWQNFNPEIVQVFLEHDIIKNKLRPAMLDKAAIKFIRFGKRDLFSTLLGDDLLREKIYTSPETKERFEGTLRYAAKSNKRGVYFNIMYSHLDFFERIKKINPFARDHISECEDDEYSSSDGQSSDDELCEEVPDRNEDVVNCVFVQKLFDAIAENNVTLVEDILDESLKELDAQGLNQLFVKTITGECNSDFRFAITKLLLKYKDVRRLLSGASLDKLARVSCYFYREDLLSYLLDDRKLRKKLYTTSKTKKDFENILKHVAQYNKKYLKMFLSKKDLRNRFSQKTRNIIFKELMMIDELTDGALDLLKTCLDDPEFCDDIQNATFVKVLGFINDVFAEEDQETKDFADQALAAVCDSLDLEDTIFEICTTKGYTSVLNKFEEGESDFDVLEECDDNRSMFYTLTQAFHAQDSTHIKYMLENKFDEIKLGELHFCLLISFYDKYYDGVTALLECCKFRNDLSGEKLFHHLQSLEKSLKEGSKHDEKMVENVIGQMCRYKKLKKRVLISVQKNKFESLKKYIKVCWI